MINKSTEEMYSKAESLFSSVPQEEVLSWCKHPVTQSLMMSLYGDMAGYFEAWSNGDYTSETAEGTVQKNSKALGGVAAIESMLAWIEDAKVGDLYD